MVLVCRLRVAGGNQRAAGRVGWGEQEERSVCMPAIIKQQMDHNLQHTAAGQPASQPVLRSHLPAPKLQA